MSFEISGKLFEVMPVVSGQGKNGTWQKQEFILEVPGNFPKKVAFVAWGDKINALAGFAKGSELKVSFDVESREYNGRWYTDIKAWKIEGAVSNNPVVNSQNFTQVNNDSAGMTFTQDGGDDLPF